MPDLPDLYSLVLKLRPLAPGTLMVFSGALVHGALLRWIKLIAPGLSEELHDGNQRRWFTCSSLRVNLSSIPIHKEQNNGVLSLWPTNTYFVRITLLRHDLFEHFYHAVTQWSSRDSRGGGDYPPFMRLGKQMFLLEEVMTTPDDSSGWCGVANLSHLVEEVRKSDVKQLTLQFSSLTTFHYPSKGMGFRQGSSYFPLLSPLFVGLARRWRDISGDHLKDLIDLELMQSMMESEDVPIILSDYQLRMHKVFLTSSFQQGFIGQCTFYVKPTDKGDELTLAQQVFLLAKLAFYTGVGYKTPMGLGQVRILNYVNRKEVKNAEVLIPEMISNTEDKSDGQKEAAKSYFHSLFQAKKLLLLHKDGLTDEELARELGLDARQVVAYRNELGAVRVSDERYTLEPTQADIELAHSILNRHSEV